MTDQEQRELAKRLADSSEVFDFEQALKVVRFDPTEAERLLREREEGERLLEELSRANQRLHRAAQEFR